MKTLVLFASKKGSTEDCANIIKNELNCDIINLKQNKNPNIEDYDFIIIGTPLYIGKPIDVVLKFCVNQENILIKKKIAFFLCGIGEAKEMIKVFKQVMPSSLTDKAITINHFGGEFRLERCNFFEKMILKKVIEKDKLDPKLNKDKIKVFISKIHEVVK